MAALPLLVAASLAAPQHEPVPVVFPMDVAHRGGAFGAVEYTPRPAEYTNLLGHTTISMVGVELPNGDVVSLDLERVDFDFSKLGVYVDEKELGSWDPGDLSLWTGTVNGDEWSEVQLGFASAGTYGWIHTAGETWNVAAFAGPNNDWSAPGVRMWAESAVDMFRSESDKQICISGEMDRNMRIMASQYDKGGPGVGNSVTRGGQLKECRVAVETDYQLFQRFGSLNAMQNYVGQLLGAISNRYETSFGVVLTYPYLQYHTNSNDGWTSQDGGGNTIDLLNEFRSAWQFNIPNGGHLGHFISGANLGGGVAWLDVLCNQNYGFAVSANIDGGVNFPVSQGGGNWDFVVISHELGHNFSSPHTHDYCPPLDRCAPSGYFGQCQNNRQCTNQGTIMSYCHLCSGGISNITTFFHPTVVSQINSAVASSCLPDYGGGQGCDDDAFEPNDDCGTALALGAGSHGPFIVKDDNSDVFRVAVPDGATLTVDVLFQHSSGDIDARLEDGICLAVLTQSTSATNNEQLVWQNNTGATQNYHVWVYNYDQNDCYSYDLDIDIMADPCAGFGQDPFENNDTCGQAAPVGDGVQLGLGVELTDPDFFEIEVEATATLTVDLDFVHANGDIDIYLYDPSISCGNNNNYLVRGFTGSDDENIAWTNDSGVDKTYVLEVQIYSGSSSECNGYVMTIDSGEPTGPGVNYCGPNNPNSTGVPGVITATGSNSIAANNLMLTASDCPPTSLGYFIVSRNQGLVQNPGGSSGNLCLFPPFGRYLQFAGPVAGNGTRSLNVDNTMIPQPTSVDAAQIGETWYFQFWHRDALLGVPTSNFTDGVGVTFQP